MKNSEGRGRTKGREGGERKGKKKAKKDAKALKAREAMRAQRKAENGS